jgi:hypothetical protein
MFASDEINCASKRQPTAGDRHDNERAPINSPLCLDSGLYSNFLIYWVKIINRTVIYFWGLINVNIYHANINNIYCNRLIVKLTSTKHTPEGRAYDYLPRGQSPPEQSRFYEAGKSST